MALDRNAVWKPGTGRFYTAEAGTPVPEDLLNPGSEWEDVGHTSIGTILGSSMEGGESTNHSSLQTRNMFVTRSAKNVTFTVNLLQFDENTLTLTRGENITIDGHMVGIPASPRDAERAWLFVLYDGTTVGGVYSPRASFSGTEEISVEEIEQMVELPVQIQPLSPDSDDQDPYYIITPHDADGGGSGE